MDLNDMSEYCVLHLLAQSNKPSISERLDVYGLSVPLNLLKVNFFLETNDSCWTRDISDSMTQRDGVYKKAEIRMYYLKQGRFVREVEKDEYLGGSFVLTNKGRRVLDRYVLFLREEQRKVNYRIKESHKISREMKEND